MYNSVGTCAQVSRVKSQTRHCHPLTFIGEEAYLIFLCIYSYTLYSFKIDYTFHLHFIEKHQG